VPYQGVCQHFRAPRAHLKIGANSSLISDKKMLGINQIILLAEQKRSDGNFEGSNLFIFLHCLCFNILFECWLSKKGQADICWVGGAR